MAQLLYDFSQCKKTSYKNLFNTVCNHYNSQGSVYYTRENGLSCIFNFFSN